MAIKTDRCSGCGEMLYFCICEFLPTDIDLDAEEAGDNDHDPLVQLEGHYDDEVDPSGGYEEREEDIPNEDPIGFEGEGFFNYMRGYC